MNSKQLQYFLATAEQGSIAAAAKHLDVAQPAISLQLTNLEHELKIKLLERDFRGVKLTDAGNRFEQHARIIMEKIQAAKTDLIGEQAECKGKVVVGLNQSSCNVLSVALLNELEHRFTDIELSFKIGPFDMIENWLAEDQIDIAVCHKPITQNGISDALPLIREDINLYISPHPQNPSYSELAMHSSIPFVELQYYDIFLPDKQDTLTIMLTKQANKSGITLKSKAAFGQLMTTLHYVTQGLGLVICPSSAVFHLESCKQLRVINIIQPSLQRDVFLQLAHKKQHEPAAMAVFELLREITALSHDNKNWRGTLLDRKYAIPSVNNIETLVTG
jgi:LysR family nitrogen assimilation transcriptional regulator